MLGRASALALVGIAALACASSAAAEIRVREDVAALSPQERQRYVAAVKELKRRASPYASGQAYDSPYTTGADSPSGTERGISWYDQFVLWHQRLSRCDVAARYRMTGHNGPLFLPWHRQFLLLFEDALREVSGSDVTVPYWDPSDAASTSATLAEDFMGGDGDAEQGWALTRGPFRRSEWGQFPVRNEGLFWGSSASPHIRRHMGSLGGPKEARRPPLSPADVARTLAVDHAYDVAPFDDSSDHTKSFRNALEGWMGNEGPSRVVCAPDGWQVIPMRRNGMHNLAHSYIGGIVGRTPEGAEVFGTMTAVPTSPNDPVFFLLHANVDRLWTLWQERNPSLRYLADPLNRFDDPAEPMEPFAADGEKRSPREVESSSALGVHYAEHPGAASPAAAASAATQAHAHARAWWCPVARPQRSPKAPASARREEMSSFR